MFRAGDPVDREKEAFVPRDSMVGNLERQVLLSTGRPGIVLYGRRRVGKSTVLRNLSGFLPSSVQIVNISMQHPEAFTSLSLLADYLTHELSKAFGERLPARDTERPEGSVWFPIRLQPNPREGEPPAGFIRG